MVIVQSCSLNIANLVYQDLQSMAYIEKPLRWSLGLYFGLLFFKINSSWFINKGGAFDTDEKQICSE